MSDIGVSYDVHLMPSTPTVPLRLSTRGTQLRVSVIDVPTVTIALTPNYSGNVLTGIISTFATPVMNAVTLTMSAAVTSIIQEGPTFDVAKIESQSLTVEGVQITLTPSNLNLSNYNGMLKISGSLDIS